MCVALVSAGAQSNWPVAGLSYLVARLRDSAYSDLHLSHDQFPLLSSACGSLKLDIKRFERDRKSTASSTAIQADLDIANRLELDGTPFFLMNRTPLSGVVPLEVMERALVDAKQALAKPALNADIAPAH